ncbi:hypothetical protein I7V28_18955 [Lelliottia amnigena]|jgi:hypothetical protein|uniref:hypothetical protein n=1 Tax=Lelliottia TaxID=1330545 RepID=UPI00192C9272|nr:MULTISPECIES: hypothetical protein [Lelliottia]MBL5885589.1 hypothetical protein [Lelliottia aquatilis]MBL5923161.1 hypothetical protein [Lelliottia amnigena]MBL5932077.1 hypothetical protein [Lelliottia amnigena]
MKLKILNVFLLVAVSSQPVMASVCANGACQLTERVQAREVSASVAASDHLTASPKTSDELARKLDGYLKNDKLKVNNDSTHKGPGSSQVQQTDELAPIRQLKVIRPELVQMPLFQLTPTGIVRFA